MEDFLAQLDRIKELIIDLDKEYLDSINNHTVSPRARTITHQIIEALSNVLDQVAFSLWKSRVAPFLTEKERETIQKNIYFPYGNDELTFKSSLGNWGVITDRNLSDYLVSLQPFESKDDWLVSLKKIARQKHIGLVPQKVTKITHVEYSSNFGTVHLISENIKFGPGVSILGAPVDPKTQRIVPTEGIKEEIDQWSVFMLEGYDLDAQSFCKGSLAKVEEIVKEVQNKFGL